MNQFKPFWLYSPYLHKSLFLGVSPEKISFPNNFLVEDSTEKPTDEIIETNINNYNRSFYLVNFRVNKNNPLNLRYKYIQYHTVFLNSFLAYIIVKEDFIKSFLIRDWGDFLTVVDSKLSYSGHMTKLLQNSSNLNDYLMKTVDLSSRLQLEDPQLALDLLKKLTLVSKDIIKDIDFGIKKDLSWFIFQYLDSSIKVSESDFYFVKDVIFVCSDLNEVLSQLKQKGYILNSHSKSQTSILDSGDTFLSHVDSDYRNNLHKLHLNLINSGTLSKNCLLPRSKFSYRNIHMNIGQVKTFSSTSFASNKQYLFQDNYTFISDILNENYYIGSYELQKKIEQFLYNQESLFNDRESLERLLNYNMVTFNLLESKLNDIKKLLGHSLSLKTNLKFTSNKYLPLVKDIIDTLGVEEVSKLLLSFFLHIVTKETVKVDANNESGSTEIPGIYTLTCFHNFGERIFNKFIFKQYINSSFSREGKTITDFINNIKEDYSLIYDVEGSYSLMGGYFVWNLVTVDLLSESIDKHPENQLHTIHYLRICESNRKYFSVNKRTYFLPQKLPMVCIPKEYTKTENGMKLGGYLLNDVLYSTPLIKPKFDHDKDTIIKNDSIILDMVNNFMKIPYKINVETLEYIYKNGLRQNIITDDNTKELHEFISNPYNKRSKSINKELRSKVSTIIMERNILSIAEVYSKMDKIYFPVRLDFRTRVYAYTDQFDYQKNDLAKGLILFANGGLIKKTDLEVIKYFKAYGANMFGHGLDKKSLVYRVKWVDQNKDKLLNFEINDIVKDSENKACFISFCFEFRRFMDFMNNNEAVFYNTYLPIQLDASCNGYQHLALLTKEKSLLDKLNLSGSSFMKDPEDFYTYVNDLLLEFINGEILRLQEESNLNAKDSTKLDRFKILIKLNFNRSILKRLIMRDSYSASVKTLVENVLNDEEVKLYKEGDKNNKRLYKYKDNTSYFSEADVYLYVTSMREVISRIAPKIKLLSSYLNNIVRICTNLQLPIPWTLPHGAVISQSYLTTKRQHIAAFSFTKSKYSFKQYMKGNYDVHKQRRAMRPNLIHSLDASTIALLYKNLSYKVDLYTIHDCFAVTANNVPMLMEKIKMIYIKLYSSNNYLIEFDSMVRLTINNTFGDDVFKYDGKYINIPDKRKIKLVEFPNIKDIINIDKNKLKEVVFPDISAITSSDESLAEVNDAIYHII